MRIVISSRIIPFRFVFITPQSSANSSPAPARAAGYGRTQVPADRATDGFELSHGPLVAGVVSNSHSVSGRRLFRLRERFVQFYQIDPLLNVEPAPRHGPEYQPLQAVGDRRHGNTEQREPDEPARSDP
jgi:hypothetical protein